MTARTFAQYSDHKILEHCRLISLDELMLCSTTANVQTKAFTNAIKTASAHECSAHLVAWRDGIVACIVTAHAKTFGELSASTIIAAYRNAVAGGDVYREISEA